MVQYEIALILRAVPRSDLHQVLRGVCTVVLQQDALLRRMENLGKRELPYKISAHKEKFSEGRYFIFDVAAAPQSVKFIQNKLRANTDVIRASVMKTGEY